MYKFCCLNPEHPEETKKDFYWGESADDDQCPGCFGKLKLMGQTTNMFAKFSSMSPEQKRAVLSRRSDDHNKRSGDIKERKERLHAEQGLKAKT
jgi:predicted Fe-S protein YdhL (DUF1289 family)